MPYRLYLGISILSNCDVAHNCLNITTHAIKGGCVTQPAYEASDDSTGHMSRVL